MTPSRWVDERGLPRGPMSTTRQIALALVLLIVAGCARADWIEGTLVTVDATGRWTGTWSGPSAGGQRTVHSN